MVQREPLEPPERLVLLVRRVPRGFRVQLALLVRLVPQVRRELMER